MTRVGLTGGLPRDPEGSPDMTEAEGGRPLFRCAAPTCPGLTWRASDRPHPAGCGDPEGAPDMSEAADSVREAPSGDEAPESEPERSEFFARNRRALKEKIGREALLARCAPLAGSALTDQDLEGAAADPERLRDALALVAGVPSRAVRSERLRAAVLAAANLEEASDSDVEVSAIIAAMIDDGGSFEKALGVAVERADPENCARIRRAFPEIWETFTARALARLAEADADIDLEE